MFERPNVLEPAWQAWLGEAQHAEQDAELLYWAHREAAWPWAKGGRYLIDRAY